MKRQDPCRNRYGPMKLKGLRQALAQRIQREFPRIGGPRMLDLCATIVLEVVEHHLRPLDSVRHGQVVWLGVDVNDPPSRRKSTKSTRFIPVILDLTTPDDMDMIIARTRRSEMLLSRAIRLFEQAYKQGALLSNVDVAIMLGADDSTIGKLLANHQRETQQIVPRRATIHDVGTGLTHKRIICWKRHAEGKSPEVVARETHHSLEAVDRYLGQYDRVSYCHKLGMESHEIARTLNCTVRLVEQYLEIDAMLTRGGSPDA